MKYVVLALSLIASGVVSIVLTLECASKYEHKHPAANVIMVSFLWKVRCTCVISDCQGRIVQRTEAGAQDGEYFIKTQQRTFPENESNALPLLSVWLN